MSRLSSYKGVFVSKGKGSQSSVIIHVTPLEQLKERQIKGQKEKQQFGFK